MAFPKPQNWGLVQDSAICPAPSAPGCPPWGMSSMPRWARPTGGFHECSDSPCPIAGHSFLIQAVNAPQIVHATCMETAVHTPFSPALAPLKEENPVWSPRTPQSLAQPPAGIITCHLSWGCILGPRFCHAQCSWSLPQWGLGRLALSGTGTWRDLQ